MKVTMIMANKY